MSKFSSFLCGFLLGVALCFGFGLYKQNRMKGNPNFVKRTTVYDTTYYSLPVTHDSVVVRYKDKYVTVSKLVVDSVTVRSGDSIPVTIPITQKTYRDSLYEAWISGYEAKLDSINVFNRTITNTVYQTNTVYKTKRWGLGVQAGYGYGIGKQGFSPYIGVGIQYNIIAW